MIRFISLRKRRGSKAHRETRVRVVAHRLTREPLKKRIRYPHRRGARPVIFRWTESYGLPVTNFMQGWINALAADGKTYEIPKIWPSSTSEITDQENSAMINLHVSFDYATYNAQTA